MALRLAGEEYSVVQGLDALGWPREIEANDADPGLKVTQSGSGPAIEAASGDIAIGANLLKTTNLAIKEVSVANLAIRDAADTVYKGLYAQSCTVESDFSAGASPSYLQAQNVDGAYMLLRARDNAVGRVEVARLAGAADPYFQATLPMVLKPSNEPGTKVEGHVWYDATAKKLKFYNGTAVETVTSS